MQASAVFEIPVRGMWPSAHLAKVVSVKDPDNLTRVQVKLYNFDGVDDQDGPLWARVAAPFAGSNKGAFMLPDVDDEVLVVFLNGDPRFPVVVGSLWNGSASAPDQLGGSGDSVDRWEIVGKGGTKITIVEQPASDATITLATPGGVTATFTDSGGGKVEIKTTTSTVTIDSQGMSVQTSSKVSVQGSTMEVNAGQVTVNAAMSKFSGVVQCDTLIATSVVGTSYTPGAGNVW